MSIAKVSGKIQDCRAIEASDIWNENVPPCLQVRELQLFSINSIEKKTFCVMRHL